MVKKLFPLLFLMLSGCSVIALLFGGASNIGDISSPITVWQEGQSEKYYDYNALVVYKATKSTLKDFGITVLHDEKFKNGNYYIIAKNKNKFTIRIERKSDKITRVKIRVDFLGDEPYADLIYQSIEEEVSNISFD